MDLLDPPPKRVHVVEMPPRDGSQCLDELVPTDERVEIIDILSDTGVDEIGLSSLTHPKAIPILQDVDEVVTRAARRDDMTYRALVSNLRGTERAIEAEVDRVNVLVTMSETYTSKNRNRTRKEVFAEMDDTVDFAHDHGIEIGIGMGTSFYCSYKGAIGPAETLTVVDSVVDSGVDEVTPVMTIGSADPVEITERFTAAFGAHPGLNMGLRPHGTNGMSLTNTLIAMAVGVDRSDAPVCGLSGGVALPSDVPGVGNTLTEDLVQMPGRMDAGHGIDFGRIEAATHGVSGRLGLGLTNHVLAGGTVEGILDTIVADGEANRDDRQNPRGEAAVEEIGH